MREHIYRCIIVFFEALPFVVSMVRFKKLDIGCKLFALLLGSSLVDEALGYYFAVRYQNNYPVYNIYSIIELFLVCLYFDYTIDVFRSRRIGLVIGCIGTVFGIVNLIFLQPLHTLNSFFLLFEGFVIIGLCLLALLRIYTVKPHSELVNSPHFWIACVLLFSWSLNYFNWGIYDIIGNSKYKSWILGNMFSIGGIITNIGYTIVYFYYPRMRSAVSNGK